MEGSMPINRFSLALLAVLAGASAGFVAYKFIGLFFKS